MPGHLTGEGKTSRPEKQDGKTRIIPGPAKWTHSLENIDFQGKVKTRMRKRKTKRMRRPRPPGQRDERRGLLQNLSEPKRERKGGERKPGVTRTDRD